MTLSNALLLHFIDGYLDVPHATAALCFATLPANPYIEFLTSLTLISLSLFFPLSLPSTPQSSPGLPRLSASRGPDACHQSHRIQLHNRHVTLPLPSHISPLSVMPSCCTHPTPPHPDAFPATLSLTSNHSLRIQPFVAFAAHSLVVPPHLDVHILNYSAYTYF